MTKPITQFKAATSLLWFHSPLCVNVYNTSRKYLDLWGPLLAEAWLTIPQKIKPSLLTVLTWFSQGHTHADTHTHGCVAVCLSANYVCSLCMRAYLSKTDEDFATHCVSLSLPVCVCVCVDVWQVLVPGELLSQWIEIEEVFSSRMRALFVHVCKGVCFREQIRVDCLLPSPLKHYHPAAFRRLHTVGFYGFCWILSELESRLDLLFYQMELETVFTSYHCQQN